MKFGNLSGLTVNVSDVHGPIALGIMGGALGALFINVNTRLGALRKKYITTGPRKILETGVFAALTITGSTLAVIALSKCKVIPTSPVLSSEEDLETWNRWTCAEGEYSQFAGLFFNTEKGII